MKLIDLVTVFRGDKPIKLTFVINAEVKQILFKDMEELISWMTWNKEWQDREIMTILDFQPVLEIRLFIGK